MKMEGRFGIDGLSRSLQKMIVWLLISVGTVEAVWDLLQVYGYEPSEHSLYALTGSFYNPGPYSGFLAMLVACAMGCRKIWVRVTVLVLGIGRGIYLSKHRPQKNARRIFKQAHTLHKAGDWQASTDLLLETMKISSDAMILNIIGKNCKAMGQYKDAEAWFIRSTHRLPNRIYP